MFIPDGSEYVYGKHPVEWSEKRIALYNKPSSQWTEEERCFVNYDYSSLLKEPGHYAWGWLGNSVPVEKRGWSDQSLKQKVIDHLKLMKDFHSFVRHCMGEHSCRICGKNQPENEHIAHGWNGELVIKHNGKTYAAPAAVGHYIETHDYNPGPEVIDALFNGAQMTYEQEQQEWREFHQKRAAAEKKAKEEEWLKKSPEERARITRINEEHEKLQEMGRAKLEQLRKSGALVE